MKGIRGNRATGSRHNKWNDCIIASTGYKLIRVGKNHPLADPNGYAKEHILVAASMHGIDAVKGKVVHHKNGDKLDNRIENLEILSRAKHNHLHNSERGRDPITGRFLERTGCLLDGREWKEFPHPGAAE